MKHIHSLRAVWVCMLLLSPVRFLHAQFDPWNASGVRLIYFEPKCPPQNVKACYNFDIEMLAVMSTSGVAASELFWHFEDITEPSNDPLWTSLNPTNAGVRILNTSHGGSQGKLNFFNTSNQPHKIRICIRQYARLVPGQFIIPDPGSGNPIVLDPATSTVLYGKPESFFQNNLWYYRDRCCTITIDPWENHSNRMYGAPALCGNGPWMFCMDESGMEWTIPPGFRLKELLNQDRCAVIERDPNFTTVPPNPKMKAVKYSDCGPVWWAESRNLTFGGNCYDITGTKNCNGKCEVTVTMQGEGPWDFLYYWGAHVDNGGDVEISPDGRTYTFKNLDCETEYKYHVNNNGQNVYLVKFLPDTMGDDPSKVFADNTTIEQDVVARSPCSTQLTATSTYQPDELAGAFIKWVNADGDVVAVGNPVVLPPGEYTMQVELPNGCKYSKPVKVTPCGIRVRDPDPSAWYINPMPVEYFMNVHLLLGEAIDIGIKVTDIVTAQPRMIHYAGLLDAGEHDISVDLQGLPPGNYAVVLIGNNTQLGSKIIYKQ